MIWRFKKTTVLTVVFTELDKRAKEV